MKTIRVGVFNLENLFLRYRLLDKEKGSREPKAVDPEKFIKEGGHINLLDTEIEDYGPISKSLRTLTARIIIDNAPDVLAVQEVESQEALFQFNRKYLKNAYPYFLVVDGNDQRQIDVGYLSKLPFESINTHQFLQTSTKDRRKKVFARDCLEVTVRAGEKRLTLFNNHFTSRISDENGKKRRDPQAKAVAEIVKERFANPDEENWIICGDFNALPDEKAVTVLESSLDAENILSRLPVSERWTYIYKGKLQQLDYLMASPALAARSAALPLVDRRGLPKAKWKFNPKLTEYIGEHGASDHCAQFWDVTL